ncbi:MAG: hypothetical protein ACFCUR_20905 [Rhodomicrobiaceae bacterium]
MIKPALECETPLRRLQALSQGILGLMESPHAMDGDSLRENVSELAVMIQLEASRIEKVLDAALHEKEETNDGRT